MRWDAADRVWVEERCCAQGFSLAGIASVPDDGSADAALEAARFAQWIAEGRAGDMAWLGNTDDAGQPLRGDLRRAFPWARSVVVCAANYNGDQPLSTDAAPPDRGWIARYAWSGQPMSDGGEEVDRGRGDVLTAGVDYHDVLLPRLEAVERELHERFGAELTTRAYVDTGPVVERSYAVRAGLGWTGKNTCLLNQQHGSWLLLGVIVCSAELAAEAWALPAADRCGSCTRCLDACPTQALTAPRVMDASRCIAYLTIEHKGAIDPALRDGMGRHVYGCDICQDVCPWNSRAPFGTLLPVRGELVNPSLAELAAMTTPQFRARFAGSPLERTGRNRVLRNVAIAIGNSADAELLPSLAPLAASASVSVREAAEWAQRKLQRVVTHPHEVAPEALETMETAGPLAATTTAASSAQESGDEPLVPSLESTAERPVAESGTWPQVLALGRYMLRTEVHTYAFSVAAQVILSLFPFIVLLLTLAKRVFHSDAMADVVSDMMMNLLPNNADFVMRNMRALANSHAGTRVFSIVMLLITTTGVFLPLEVALNSVWGVTKNRSYLANQVVSIGLAVGVGVLAMLSVAATAAQRTLLTWIFFGHTDNLLYRIAGRGFLELCATAAGIGIFFLVYWGLPNRKVPPRAVLPTAIVVGLLWELAKYIYVLVLPRLDFASVYGPFRVSVGLMMWAFISGLLLLAGAYVSATREALRETRADERTAAAAELQREAGLQREV